MESTADSVQNIVKETVRESVSNLSFEDILNQYGLVEAYFQVSLDPDKDLQLTTSVGLALAVLFAIITGVGLIANGVVFFVIIAGNEIGKWK